MSQNNTMLQILGRFLSGGSLTTKERMEVFDLAYSKYSMEGNYE